MNLIQMFFIGAICIAAIGAFTIDREPDKCTKHMSIASHMSEPVRLMCWNQLTQTPRKCKE